MTNGKPGSATTSGWFMALLLSALLAGCGGGGDSGSTTTIVEGQGNFGAEIVGGTVQMVCAGSTAGTTVTTSATGGFTVTAPGSPPCVIKISGGNLVGGPFYSIFEAGQARANVNQLTTMLAFLLADGNPETFFTSPSTISTKITAAAVATDKETVRANVIANLASAVTPAISTSFDFLKTAFTSDSTGFDQMLDKLGFASTGNTAASITFDGAPLLAVNPASNVGSTTTSTPISSVTLTAAGPSGTAGIPGTVLPGASAMNTVGSARPGNLATNVATSTNSPPSTVTGKTVTATFTQAMDPTTITPVGTFTIKQTIAGTNVPGIVTMNAANTIATFTPSGGPLLVSTQYTATVSTAAKSAIAPGPTTSISNAVAWSFTTAGSLITAEAPVDLQSLSTFVAVAGAGLTNSNAGGVTTLNGDVGLSPTGTCLGDGSPCAATNPTINGTLYANDPGGVAAQAKTDLTAAYVDAASRPPGTTVNDISGMVLIPGVYTSASTMSIAVGQTVTLDPQGDADAVWIFQIGSSLTANNSAVVNILPPGKANNVYWAIAASSTIGSNVDFKGNVLAGASNSVGTNSTVLGRLLCTTGQITLLSNTITLPTP